METTSARDRQASLVPYLLYKYVVQGTLIVGSLNLPPLFTVAQKKRGGNLSEPTITHKFCTEILS